MDSQRKLYSTYLRSYVIGMLELDVEVLTQLVASMGEDDELDIAIAMGISDAAASESDPESLKDFLTRLRQKLTPVAVRDGATPAKSTERESAR